LGYIEQNLMPGEQVILKAELHWAQFVGSAIRAGVGLLFLIASLAGSEDTRAVFCLFGWAFFLLGLLYAARTAVSYFTTEFAVTDKRVIAKTGFLDRRSVDLLLSKVESIGVNQPIMGRMFNYGTIVVVGTGGTEEGFPNIADPMDFRKCINTQIAGSA